MLFSRHTSQFQQHILCGCLEKPQILRGTFVTKPVQFQSQYRQSKKTSLSANFSCSYSILFLHAFTKIFYLFLNSFMQGLKTTAVLSFRKILMIASTLPDL